MRNLKAAFLGAICLSLASVATAERKWPDNKFHCQVVTESGARGLVSMQTYNKKMAVEGVVGLTAITDQDTVETAKSVVQCIEPARGEKFSDLGFRSWLSTLEEY